MREVDDMLRQNRSLRAELNSRQLDLLTHALKNPAGEYTIASHRRAHDVAYGTARSDLLDLAHRRLLERRQRGRQFLFVAPPRLREKLRPSGTTA
jgi:Fic family protein